MVNLLIYGNGYKWWFLNDQYHRANGPTIVWTNGDRFWFWYDRRVSEFEHMMLAAQERTNG